MVLGLKNIQKLNHKKMKPSDFLSIETETSFDSIQNSDEILISNPTQTIGVNRTSEESPGMDTMEINNNRARKTQDRDRTAKLSLQSKSDDVESVGVIDETVESTRCFKKFEFSDNWKLRWAVVAATLICNLIFGKYRRSSTNSYISQAL